MFLLTDIAKIVKAEADRRAFGKRTMLGITAQMEGDPNSFTVEEMERLTSLFAGVTAMTVPEQKPAREVAPASYAEPAKPKPETDDERLQALADLLGVDPSQLQIMDARTPQPPVIQTYNDDDVVQVGGQQYRYGDIPKDADGNVDLDWMNEHCTCGRDHRTGLPLTKNESKGMDEGYL